MSPVACRYRFLAPVTGTKLNTFSPAPETGAIKNPAPEKYDTLTSYWYQSTSTDNWRQKTVQCVISISKPWASTSARDLSVRLQMFGSVSSILCVDVDELPQERDCNMVGLQHSITNLFVLLTASLWKKCEYVQKIIF